MYVYYCMYVVGSLLLAYTLIKEFRPKWTELVLWFLSEVVVVVVKVKQSLYTPWRRLGGEEV
jgi:hypothetical protein